MVLSGLAGSWLAASTAAAFSEPLLYAEPTLMGGGGGRFFTGSPLDSYSCVVCHTGAPPPSVNVVGFPESYVPGKTYEVELTWSEPKKPHALNLEIVDEDGRAAGVLSLPAEDELEQDLRCNLAEEAAMREESAANLLERGERTIVGVRPCGARSVRFSFKAPDERVIALTAAVLRSDESEDASGDGVLELRRIAYRRGEAAPEEAEGCSASPRASSTLVGLLPLLLAALLQRRRAT